MLDEFIRAHREEILVRTRAKVADRLAPLATSEELSFGVPVFLDQLAARLADEAPSDSDINTTASSHGVEMMRHGFSVGQLVKGYGDVCQAVTGLAISLDAPITTEEFRTLNRCLDTATAEAVTAYQHQRDRAMSGDGNERLGVLAHELRNVLNSAVISFDVLKRGSVGVGGSTGAVLGRSLAGLRDLIDRALAEVRLEAGTQRQERVRVWEFIEELEVIATFEANSRGMKLTVTCADDGAEILIDRHIVAAAVGNLLQNAFKFTRPEGHIALRATATASRVRIEVADECGGLPRGSVDGLFRPFEQRGFDRTGLGLGLAISRRGVESNGGEIHVQDLPGTGCIFTVDLPRAPALSS